MFHLACGSHPYISSSTPTQGLQRESSAAADEDSQRLLSAVYNKDVHSLRGVIEKTLDSTGKSVLTTPSLKLHHKHRTPFMEAAAGGDLSIFVTLLHAFERQHPGEVRMVDKRLRSIDREFCCCCGFHPENMRNATLSKTSQASVAITYQKRLLLLRPAYT